MAVRSALTTTTTTIMMIMMIIIMMIAGRTAGHYEALPVYLMVSVYRGGVMDAVSHAPITPWIIQRSSLLHQDKWRGSEPITGSWWGRRSIKFCVYDIMHYLVHVKRDLEKRKCPPGRPRMPSRTLPRARHLYQFYLTVISLLILSADQSRRS